MLTPNPIRIGDIFNSTSKYAVPRYQREYKWGLEEAKELIEDIGNYVESKNEKLFLGTLIFEAPKNGLIHIVDGQQRITTLLILLLACRTQAKKVNPPLATKINEKIAFVDEKTAKVSGARLVASESIRLVIDYLCSDAWDGVTFPQTINKKGVKRPIGKIKPIYLNFLNAIEKFDDDQLGAFLGAVYDSYVFRVEVPNEMEALSIFERTNGRGLDLEISDLLKNYLFSEDVKDMEKSWDQILDNSGGTLLRMLKYFYVSKKGYVLKPELYKKLKAYAKEDGMSAAVLTKELTDFSQFFNVVKKGDLAATREFLQSVGCTAIAEDADKHERIYYSLQALREFNIAQFCPLAFSAIECFVESGFGEDSNKSKHLVGFFELLEKYHFVNNAVCERVGHAIEKTYADLSQKFSNSSDFLAMAKELRDALKEKIADRNEFLSRFTTISYGEDPLGVIAYIFDKFYNQGLRPQSWIRVFNPDPSIAKRNFNTEHIFPQKPEGGLPKEMLECVDQIGNLLCLGFVTNSSLGNLSPGEKVQKLEGPLSRQVQNVSAISDFIAFYKENGKWGPAEIAERSKRMANWGYENIWNF